MTNKKTTRRALLVSLVVMLLSFTMLLGTTFAWFTDTASVGVNTIQAGTLDIELQMKDEDGDWVNAEGKTLNFKKANTYYGTEALWEPGCTYELPAIRVVNNGNLAAVVLVLLDGVTGDEKLLEAIEFKTTISEDPTNDLNGVSYPVLYKGTEYAPGLFVEEGNVLVDWSVMPNGETAPNTGHTWITPAFTVSGHMKEDAGNEYQGLKLEGVSIKVLATQQVYEYDSNGREYDDNAPYPADEVPEGATVVANANDLLSLCGKNLEGTIALTADIYMPEGAALKPIGAAYDKSLKVIGNGHTIYNATFATLTENVHNGMTNSGMFFAYTGSTLEISDLKFVNATVEASNNTGYTDAAVVVGYADGRSTVTLNNVDVIGSTVNNTIGNAAILVGYSTGVVNLTDCEVSDSSAVGERAEKTGAFVGTANGASCVVTLVNCSNATTLKNFGRVIYSATVIE